MINRYLSGSCNLIYPMARASRSSYSLPYKWPPKSDLLLRNSGFLNELTHEIMVLNT